MSITPTLAGFAVGLLVGATGVGAGSLMAPILIVGLGIDPVRAVGTDLAFATVTKLTGAWQHARRGSLDLRAAGWLAAGSMPAALIAIMSLHALLDQARMQVIVSRSIGFVLLLSAATLLLRPLRSSREPDRRPVRPPIPLLIAVGAVVGTLVGLTSIGSGALVLGALSLLTRLDLRRIVGTDLAHATLLGAVGAAAYAGRGSVDAPLVVALLAGSIPGVMVGSRMATRVPERALRIALFLVLCVAGLHLAGGRAQ